MYLSLLNLGRLEPLIDLLEKVAPSPKLEVVVVKSNVCGYYPPSRELLKAVLSWAAAKSSIAYVGDTPSTMYNVKERLVQLGLFKLATEIGSNVRAVDLMRVSDSVKVRVPHPHALRRYPIPRVVVEADLLVNVARLGRHSSTQVTGALKNLFGLVASRMKYLKYHPLGVNRVIADLAQIISPHANLVEVGDNVVFSDDPLVADVAAVIVEGGDPCGIRHFSLVAGDRGLNLEELAARVKELLPQLREGELVVV